MQRALLGSSGRCLAASIRHIGIYACHRRLPLGDQRRAHRRREEHCRFYQSYGEPVFSGAFSLQSRESDATRTQIYSSSFQAAFNDITAGSNPGCDTNGFNAEPGWDPVTGVGTPNVAMLRELWLELP